MGSNGEHELLRIAMPFLKRLTFLALRLELRGQSGPIYDISEVYSTLDSVKRSSGHLRRCLIQGSVTPPPASVDSWIIYEEKTKAGEHIDSSLKRRSRALTRFDPGIRLKELVELEIFCLLLDRHIRGQDVSGLYRQMR
jgi:hypothetical protein